MGKPSMESPYASLDTYRTTGALLLVGKAYPIIGVHTLSSCPLISSNDDASVPSVLPFDPSVISAILPCAHPKTAIITSVGEPILHVLDCTLRSALAFSSCVQLVL